MASGGDRGPSYSVGAAVRLAAGDALVTFLWVFCAATLGASTHFIASALGLLAVPAASLFIITSLVALLIFVFTFLGDLLGGASFNPTGVACFYAAGFGKDGLFSMALRFPAQALGAVGGALAIVEYMPPQYKHMLGGPSVKVDLHTAAAAEGVLTFIISFAVLWIVIKGPRNPIIQIWLISISTVALVVGGGAYSGPSMNPANAFGWAYVNKSHDTWEQFYVYWIPPFVGAILAAWFFRIIFPPQAEKAKKA